MELSLPGTKMPWNFRSRERKSDGTFVLGNENGTFALNQNTRMQRRGQVSFFIKLECLQSIHGTREQTSHNNM